MLRCASYPDASEQERVPLKQSLRQSLSLNDDTLRTTRLTHCCRMRVSREVITGYMRHLRGYLACPPLYFPPFFECRQQSRERRDESRTRIEHVHSVAFTTQ